MDRHLSKNTNLISTHVASRGGHGFTREPDRGGVKTAMSLDQLFDTSRRAPVPVDAPADAETGRGLMLVATLSTDWGYHRTSVGKAVYFTLAPQDDF